MTTEPYNLIDYGNLAIGIGTFFLAFVLAIVNWKSSVRNRSVHIADKRQDWMTEFRNLISELLCIQNKLLRVDSSVNIERDQLYQHLATIQYKIHFMFPEGNFMAEKLEKAFGLSAIELSKVNPEPTALALNREEIMTITIQILEEQRENIVKLRNEDILI